MTRINVETERDKDEWRFLKNLLNAVEEAMGGETPCAYCGAASQCDEHIVPISYLATYLKRSNSKRRLAKYIVRACNDCNRLAGPSVFDNFWEKKKYIAQRIRTKYKKQLAAPDWNEEELMELRGRLRSHVYQNEYNKKLMKLRLENLDKPEVIGEPQEYV